MFSMNIFSLKTLAKLNKKLLFQILLGENIWPRIFEMKIYVASRKSGAKFLENSLSKAHREIL